MISVAKLSDQVHELLLRQILEGRRAPGSVLRETELADDLQVSRTPIREAISQLAAERFVNIEPNRGATVRVLDGEQVREIFQMREALEAWAAGQACAHMAEEDLEQLQAIAHRIAEGASGASRQLWQFDRSFHTTIARHAGNQLLTEEVERYIDLAGLVGVHAHYRAGDAEGACRQHMEVLCALQERHAERARQAMAEHLRSAAELIVLRMPPCGAQQHGEKASEQ